ncbi:uncharacterized protein LOC136084654 isoform X2 [Hydra vulgaris]|uniref:Uncharacterized protein LOC136084654 isoform X2 n=1 Tax=Hydra vulgaris TaxID=6087 RepID=A0ABM4CHF2_HYDVU
MSDSSSDHSVIKTRKRSRPNTSPVKRLYSVVTISEDNILKKVTVPLHWVNNKENIVYWPPKSKKQFNYYISNWVDPDINWLKFQLKKVHLDMATKDICDICINIDTETSSHEIEKTENESFKSDYREPSPDIHMVIEPSSKKKYYLKGQQDRQGLQKSGLLKTHSEIVERSKENSVVKINSSEVELAEIEGFNSTNRKQRPLETNRIGGKFMYSNPPETFKALDERCLQYALFMELSSVKSQITQLEKAVERLGRQMEPEMSAFHIEKSSTLEDFQEKEEILKKKDDFLLLVSRLKQIGGNTPSSIINKALDETMSKKLQAKFSKVGKNGKRPFKTTYLYKALLGALVTERLSKENVDRLIGDHLKRAPRAEDKK